MYKQKQPMPTEAANSAYMRSIGAKPPGPQVKTFSPSMEWDDSEIFVCFVPKNANKTGFLSSVRSADPQNREEEGEEEPNRPSGLLPTSNQSFGRCLPVIDDLPEEEIPDELETKTNEKFKLFLEIFLFGADEELKSVNKNMQFSPEQIALFRVLCQKYFFTNSLMKQREKVKQLLVCPDEELVDAMISCRPYMRHQRLTIVVRSMLFPILNFLRSKIPFEQKAICCQRIFSFKEIKAFLKTAGILSSFREALDSPELAGYLVDMSRRRFHRNIDSWLKKLGKYKIRLGLLPCDVKEGLNSLISLLDG